jgi:hypothetical protein
MTRPEITGKRDLGLSGWIRKNCPDSSTGYYVTDIDFFIANNENYMVLESKTNGTKQMPYAQKKLLRTLNNRLEFSDKNESDFWLRFRGCFIVSLSGTLPEDSNSITVCSLDDYSRNKWKKLSLEEFRAFMSFELFYEDIGIKQTQHA